jgi:sugar phosphate permease
MHMVGVLLTSTTGCMYRMFIYFREDGEIASAKIPAAMTAMEIGAIVCGVVAGAISDKVCGGKRGATIVLFWSMLLVVLPLLAKVCCIGACCWRPTGGAYRRCVVVGGGVVAV